MERRRTTEPSSVRAEMASDDGEKEMGEGNEADTRCVLFVS